MYRKALLHSTILGLLLMLPLAEISAQDQTGTATDTTPETQQQGAAVVAAIAQPASDASAQPSGTGASVPDTTPQSSQQRAAVVAAIAQPASDANQESKATNKGDSGSKKTDKGSSDFGSGSDMKQSKSDKGSMSDKGSGKKGNGDSKYSKGRQQQYQSNNGYQNYNNGYRGYGDSYEYDNDGIDPDRYGQDFDTGPIRNYRKPMEGSMEVFIYALDDWEGPGQEGYNEQYGRGSSYDGNTNQYPNTNYQNGNSYNNGGNYKNNNYRKKRSYSRVRFPVRQFKNYRDFPIERFPPLISIFPWLPIFFDKITYQTFIFSPTGGIYIIPPLINFYGQRFAVAQLIKWGYASLVSTGAPPPPGVNIAPLVQPAPIGGAPLTAGVVGTGGAAPAPAPAYNTEKARYDGGVKTDFPKFKPRYSQTIEEGGNRQYGSPSKPNYGPDSNYGGTGQQQVYAQGNQRPGSPRNRS